MSTPCAPPRKRAASAPARSQTPSKKAKTLKITSCVVPRHHPAAEQEALPAQRQEVHDRLRRYLDSIIERDATARPAEKKRNALRKIEIVAAMAVLYAPWDDEEWAFWYRGIRKTYFNSFFVDGLGTATEKLVKACKSLQSPMPLGHMISNLVQGGQDRLLWSAGRTRQGP